MGEQEIRALLERVRSGETPPEEAARLLSRTAYEDLGYAKVDHHRAARQGAAEVIFGEGKTAEQIEGIVRSMMGRGAENIIITPICAHSLHAKPFVLDAGRSVGVRLVPGSKKTAYLSVDGGRAFRVLSGDWVECRRSRQTTQMVKLTGRSFYERINQKLGKA